ncbi:MAG: hypothetical protein ACK48P_01645 [Holosporales bacterium]
MSYIVRHHITLNNKEHRGSEQSTSLQEEKRYAPTGYQGQR